VSGRSDHEIAGAELLLFAVVHDDLDAPGDAVPHVRCLTALCLRDGLDMLRPLPARLERGPAHRSLVEVYELELPRALFERTRLFGRIEALAYKTETDYAALTPEYRPSF